MHQTKKIAVEIAAKIVNGPLHPLTYYDLVLKWTFSKTSMSRLVLVCEPRHHFLSRFAD
jgi:hypothetical protein